MVPASGSRPLGISWTVLESWVSGRGVRDVRHDTVLSCQRPDVRQPDALSDWELQRLCVELDIGATGREAQLAALSAPVASTADVQRFIVAPLCARDERRRCAYLELLDGEMVCESVWHERIPATGPATLFVSHAWSMPFDGLLSALEEHMCSVPLDERAAQYVWLDVMCVNPFEAVGFGAADWATTFACMVQAIGHTLLVCLPALAPVAVARSWCIYEIFCTLQADCALSVVTSAAEAATLRDIGSFERAIGALGGIRSEAAAASYAEDKRRIDAAILAAGGFERIDQSHTRTVCSNPSAFGAPCTTRGTTALCVCCRHRRRRARAAAGRAAGEGVGARGGPL